MHLDLGVRDGPVMLFGGPYSNLQATLAVLGAAKKFGIGGDNIICTGDVVAYCADPSRTVDAIRRSGAVVIAGNCEKQLGAGATDCGCGFEEGTTCDLLSVGWYAHANKHVKDGDRLWMRQLPDIVSFQHQGARYAVIHGGVSQIAKFIWPTDEDAVFAKEFEAAEEKIGTVDHIIAGHSGIPFIRSLDARRWINAGVIGMPPHDGRQQTRFAILDGGEILIHHLRYKSADASDAMVRVGLTQGYHESLLSGYWPSEDVLPPGLRLSSLARG